MAVKKGRSAGTDQSAAEVPRTAAALAPPQPSRWQLVTSAVLVALWIIFLGWMAFTG